MLIIKFYSILIYKNILSSNYILFHVSKIPHDCQKTTGGAEEVQ